MMRLTMDLRIPCRSPRSPRPSGRERVMRSCTICHFDAELDDVVIACGERRCICLRCFGRETGDGRRVPWALPREIEAVLAATPVI